MRIENEEGDEEVSYSGFDENPGEEYLRRHWRRVNMSQLKKLNKTKLHCGNMLVGLKQGKGVEPLNFIAPIATIITQVHTLVPENTSAGKFHGMEINK